MSIVECQIVPTFLDCHFKPAWLSFRQIIVPGQTYKESVSQLVLYSPLGSGLPAYEHRKQLTPLNDIYNCVYNQSQEERLVRPRTQLNCPDSVSGTALNASSICLSPIWYDGTKIRII